MRVTTFVDTLIGIRIMLYCDLYVVIDEPSQPIWNRREGGRKGPSQILHAFKCEGLVGSN